MSYVAVFVAALLESLAVIGGRLVARTWRRRRCAALGAERQG